MQPTPVGLYVLPESPDPSHRGPSQVAPARYSPYGPDPSERKARPKETPAQMFAKEALDGVLPEIPVPEPPRRTSVKEAAATAGVVDTRGTPAPFVVRSLVDLRKSVERSRDAVARTSLSQLRTEELAKPRNGNVKTRLDPLAVHSPSGLPAMLALIGSSKLFENEQVKQQQEDLTTAAHRNHLATDAFREVRVADPRESQPPKNRTVELRDARVHARQMLKQPTGIPRHRTSSLAYSGTSGAAGFNDSTSKFGGRGAENAAQSLAHSLRHPSVSMPLRAQGQHDVDGMDGEENSEEAFPGPSVYGTHYSAVDVAALKLEPPQSPGRGQPPTKARSVSVGKQARGTRKSRVKI